MLVKILQEIAEIKQLLLTQNLLHKEILTLAETAEFLGVSKSYVYKMTCSRQIPFYRPTGKIVFFQRSEIMEWLLRNRQADSLEIIQKTVSKLIK